MISRFRRRSGRASTPDSSGTMAGTGLAVVTAAGLVFAFTMCGFAFGDLGWCWPQIGTTIGVGLIFDT